MTGFKIPRYTMMLGYSVDSITKPSITDMVLNVLTEASFDLLVFGQPTVDMGFKFSDVILCRHY